MFYFLAGFDARFPNTNQTKHCWQNYVDYFKCIKARGEDFAPCQQFFRAYHSLCPNDFVSVQKERNSIFIQLLIILGEEYFNFV